VLRDSAVSSGTAQFAVQAVAPSLGVEVSPVNVRNASEIERGVAAIARAANGGLGLAVRHRDLIIARAGQHKLPAVYYDRYFVTAGGLISYGPDLVDQYRQAAKSTEGEFETTRRGYRFTTSVGGTLTGRGGSVLIIDDPIKANDANSVIALEGAIDWFRNTALSRLDNSGESLIIVTMQRLHMNDLSGILIESGWPKLVLPAIATEPMDLCLPKIRFG